MIKRLVISAPFGNYLNFPGATSTLGTYTRNYRGGFWWRLWRVLATVRYYPGIGAWKNKLGLPNPGIVQFVRDVRMQRIKARDKIVSVAGHCLSDWYSLVTAASTVEPQAIELNCSCPNCPGEDKSDYPEVFKALFVLSCALGTRLIVKLPPVNYMPLVRAACAAGLDSFHCCNTLPTGNGGMSGKPLKILSLQAVRDVCNYTHAKNYQLAALIGGGGVTHFLDAKDYLDAGATHVAVGTVLFNPLNWPRIEKLAEQVKNYGRPPRPDKPTIGKIEQV